MFHIIIFLFSRFDLIILYFLFSLSLLKAGIADVQGCTAYPDSRKKSQCILIIDLNLILKITEVYF